MFHGSLSLFPSFSPFPWHAERPFVCPFAWPFNRWACRWTCHWTGRSVRLRRLLGLGQGESGGAPFCLPSWFITSKPVQNSPINSVNPMDSCGRHIWLLKAVWPANWESLYRHVSGRLGDTRIILVVCRGQRTTKKTTTIYQFATWKITQFDVPLNIWQFQLIWGLTQDLHSIPSKYWLVDRYPCFCL